ncbi:O-methyltransferase [Streptomyces armeniacus]|uniref:O-methyltransferase n=1 Tax=Streptomyces armeniacus TaxID=83291 RepID=A0A345XYV7_9ACTN|nr:O-methyltransferase [Streptomyces armeniacus]AXK36823.1 O-methyltransferase [Streptomyces armeniacus]
MSQNQWTDVDQFLTEQLHAPDDVLDAAIADSVAAGLPEISVSANQGKLLHLIARIQAARTVLEIGTLGGYSTIWLARALPEDGRLVTLEADPGHADVARANLTRAGLDKKVEVRVGNAVETLPQLVDDEAAPFDLVFIDADKPNNPTYLEWSLKLTRPGSIIIGDNVVRDGTVVDAGTADPKTQGSRKLVELIGQNPRLSATAVQTVGTKGYDGFVLARVTE